jgi:hypothetical protein
MKRVTAAIAVIGVVLLPLSAYANNGENDFLDDLLGDLGGFLTGLLGFLV